MGEVFSAHPLTRQQGAEMIGDAQSREQMLAEAGKFRLTKSLQAKQAADHRQQELADEASRRAFQLDRDREQARQSAIARAASRSDASAEWERRKTYEEGLRKEREAQEAAAKADAYNQQVAVPGLERGPGAPRIKVEEAQGMRTAKAMRDDLMSQIDEMQAIHSGDDTTAGAGTEMFGDKATRMSSLSTSMLMTVKELAKLGVLSQSDITMVNKMVPDPTSFWSNVKASVGYDQTPSQLNELRRNMDEKYRTHAQSLGYREAGGPIKITGDEDYAKLPSGTPFAGPDGVTRIKP